MNVDELRHRLLSDLREINLPVDEVDVFLRPYSKTFYGRYFPVYDDSKVRPKIYVYPYADKLGNFLPYTKILETVIHEFCHHIQYASAPEFVRVKGVMHNAQFWQLYNHYLSRAQSLEGVIA